MKLLIVDVFPFVSQSIVYFVIIGVALFDNCFSFAHSLAKSFYFPFSFSMHFQMVPTVGVVVAVFYCLLKQHAEYSDADHGTTRDQDAMRGETEPILPRKEVVVSYGATEEQPESSMGSADDLYSEKVCKICYDAARSCFFIPCGHGFTCFTCARRIVEDENKTCPICRRLIHRVRRLGIP